MFLSLHCLSRSEAMSKFCESKASSGKKESNSLKHEIIGKAYVTDRRTYIAGHRACSRRYF